MQQRKVIFFINLLGFHDNRLRGHTARPKYRNFALFQIHSLSEIRSVHIRNPDLLLLY